MKKLAVLLALFPIPALADTWTPPLSSSPSSPPSAEESLARDKIQFGQLLIQLGNDELEISQLRKELDAMKQAAKSPNANKGTPHVP